MAIRLTEAQQERLFTHIREKWTNRRQCPMCSHRKWSIDASIYRLAAMTADLNAPRNVVQPLATVRCAHCSFVALIHLTQSGIATAEELSLGEPQDPIVVPHVERGGTPVPLAPPAEDDDDGEVDDNDATR